ncbi:hypothetical protein [Streptomyces sp. NPDC101234]|uniref:hypothetical protein n=1 Tax=Streptomyces sp. NPDC101234 TaxID=3366138 RepID=UPI00382DEE02
MQFGVAQVEGGSGAVAGEQPITVDVVEKRREEPTAVILDSQTVRGSVNVPKDTTVLDPGKKSPGRPKRLLSHAILTEPEPGLFTLTPPALTTRRPTQAEMRRRTAEYPLKG